MAHSREAALASLESGAARTSTSRRHERQISVDTNVSRNYGAGHDCSRQSSRHSNTGSLQLPPEIVNPRTSFSEDVFETLRSSRHASFGRTSLYARAHANSLARNTIIGPDDVVPDPNSPDDGDSDDRDNNSPISDVPAPQNEENQPAQPSYPSPAKTALIMFSLYISIFLVALDRTIMGPAIPAITNQFQSTKDIGWYGSAYMLTACGFILLYGRVYTFFPTKPVFLSGIALFEVGSAVCGAANSSMVLIIGRAIQGLGSSGIFTGAILIMTKTVPLHRRPMLQGLFGACFGVASVVGPLLGGVFTGSRATWRWCFYINLPIGGFTILVVLLLLRLDEQPREAGWKEQLKYLDPVGTILFLPAVTCLLLALEWGAAEYSWGAPRIVGLLVVFAVLICAFAAWQYVTRNTTATVPGRILFQRSVACGGLSQFCVGAAMLTFANYIPLWFQAIADVSAMQSGINTIPLVLSVVVGSISTGGLAQLTGYYTPFMILGSCLMAVGSGLLTTWSSQSAPAAWIGFQIILGLGVGCTMQHPNLAVQVVLPGPDIPTGTALLAVCQTLGGAVFVAVGQNVFIDKFTGALEAIGGIDPAVVLQSGATDLKQAVPESLLPRVLAAYNTSLTHGPFLAALIVSCLAVPAALGMEWRSVKEGMQHKQGDEESSSSSVLVEQGMSEAGGGSGGVSQTTGGSTLRRDGTATEPGNELNEKST